jgi:hypothetical protein
MPLWYIGRNEYYPNEMMYQVQTKRRGANADHDKEVVLKFHDNIGGKAYFEEANDLATAFEQTRISSAFGLKSIQEPMRLHAKLLAEPKLRFANEPLRDRCAGGSDVESIASIQNGSWNLNKKTCIE